MILFVQTLAVAVRLLAMKLEGRKLHGSIDSVKNVDQATEN